MKRHSQRGLRHLAAASLSALTLAGFSPAFAATITLSKQQSDIFGGNGRAQVNVTSTANPNRSYNGNAGAFALVGSGGVGNITTFCVDLLQSLNLPGTVQTSSTPATFPNSRVAALEKLFETGYKSLDLASNTQAAGFQLAVWEVIFESAGSYNIDSGNFKSNWGSASNAAAAFAKTLLAGMSGPITQDYQLTFYLSDSLQDQVSVAAVPVPAAGLLLLGGLGGLVALRRKRKEILRHD